MSEIYLKWHKLDDHAIIPSKRVEDAGYDLYTIENNVMLMPGEKHIFSTGLQSAFSPLFVGIVKERGSTGTNLLAVRSGVIDSGYRGEWKVVIQNLGKIPVLFTNAVKVIQNMNGKVLLYPTSKAIAQVSFLNLAQFRDDDVEVVDEDLTAIQPSYRENGGWGSSGK